VPAAPAFPIDVFPDTLRDFAGELAAATRAPIDLTAGVMLGAASAAIGQSLQLALKASWRESALVYLVLIAPAGGKFTPVRKLALEPLEAIDARLRQATRAAYDKWGIDMLCHRLNRMFALTPPRPPRSRLIVRGTSRCSLGIALRDNPRGLLCDLDDGSAWLAAVLDARAQNVDRPFWVANHGGSPITLERQGDGAPIHLEFPFAAVVAGVSPEALAALGQQSNGNTELLDRCLFLMPELASWPAQRWDDRAPGPRAKRAWADVIERLYGQAMVDDADRCAMRPGVVTLTKPASRAWRAWYDAVGAEIDAPACPVRRRAVLGKSLGAAARLALILSRLRLAVDSKPDLAAPVGVADIEAAVRLVHYFDVMRTRAYAVFSRDGLSQPAARIVAWLRRTARSRFTESDLRSDLLRSLSAFDRDAGLRELERWGAIRPDFDDIAEPWDEAEADRRGRRGRKRSDAFAVHPGLFSDEPALGDAVHQAHRVDEAVEPVPIPAVQVISGAVKRQPA
jgi:hypothetical protein